MNKPSLKKLFAVSVLALLFLSMFAGLGVWQIKPAQASYIFSSDWESSGGSDVTDGGLWMNTSGTPTVSAISPAHGNYSMLINAVEYVNTSITPAGHVFARCYVNFSSLPDADYYSIDIMGFYRSANGMGYPTHLLVYVNATDHIAKFRLWEEVQNIGIMLENPLPVIGTQYCVEMEVNSDGTGGIWIDGTNYGNYSGGLTSNLVGFYAGAVGNGLSKIEYIDDVVYDDAYIGPLASSTYSLTINSTPISVSYEINSTDTSRYSVTAASGYWEDIQNAVDDVTANGTDGIGDVHIPAGTFNFTDVDEWRGVQYGPMVFFTPKVRIYGASYTMDGNGMVTSYGTILQLPWNNENAVGGSWFGVQGSGTRSTGYGGWQNDPTPNDPSIHTRISGIWFVGYRYISNPYNDTAMTKPAIQLNEVLNYRIDHCNFTDVTLGGVLLGFYGPPDGGNYSIHCDGVIDHCTFLNDGDCHLGPGGSSDGETVGYGIAPSRTHANYWDSNINNIFGHYTNYTTVIENCNFSKWRHCVSSVDGYHVVFRYNNVYGDLGFGSVDEHGNYGGVGTRAVEMYNCTFTDCMEGYTHEANRLRGGAGVFFNNTVDSSYGLFVGTSYDGFTPNKCLVGYMPDCPLYIWDNTLAYGVTINSFGSYIPLVEDENLFYSALPDYVPYTYPFPSVADTFGYTNDTVSLAEGTYLVTVPSQVVSGEYTYNFSHWQDSSTNTTLTVSLTANTTITATYTDVTEVIVIIILPVSTTYAWATIPVSISASGGIIDTIWWNCKKGTSWIYSLNQTYTTSTSMLGLTDGTYTLYGWANNTDGNSDEETVMFTVSIYTPPTLFPKGGYYYFITGTRTTNNVTGSKLDSSSGFALSTVTQTNAGNCSVSYAFTVYIIKHDGSLIDVTGITATITRLDLGEGFQNGYASISYTTLALGYQALRVRLYICFDGEAWYVSGDYVTEILVEKAVDTSTWNFTVYTKRSYDAGTNITSAQFMFGDQSHNSRIENVAFIDPLAQEIALWKLESGDIIGGMLYPFMLYTGNLIYGLGIMFVSGVLYLRHKKWEVILTFFLLYAGGAGIGYLIPDVAYRLVYIVIWFVLTIVLYRVFR